MNDASSCSVPSAVGAGAAGGGVCVAECGAAEGACMARPKGSKPARDWRSSDTESDTMKESRTNNGMESRPTCVSTCVAGACECECA